MTESSTRKYHRVLLQIEATTHCQEAVGAALDIAARLGGELYGLFIEDADLLSVGELDFIREFRLSSPTAHRLDRLTLEGQLRAMSRSVQRQLEQAANRRKVTVGFRSIRGDLLPAEDETFINADLVIIENTSRLYSRSFRGRFSISGGAFSSMRPTLLLKRGQRLAPCVTIICDSVEAADSGLRSIKTLLGTLPHNITMLPYGVNEEELKKILDIVEKFSVDTEDTSRGGGQINVTPVVPSGENRTLELLSPENCVVVVKMGGAVMGDPALMDALIVSRHPLLFLQ